MEALDRIFATLGVARSDARALDATLRRGDLAPAPPQPTTARAGKPRDSSPTTAPFLPSITLADQTGAAGEPAPTHADLLVTAVLGEGGMGVVHLAGQRSLDRSVAIKRPLAGTGGASLVEEARTMAHVEHPNVVPVHALGRDSADRPVLVMKRVHGASLRDLLRDASHPAWPALESRHGDRRSASLAILGAVADALELAHARGVVHRDVKPENVMVGEFGEVYLLDWGIAHRIGAAVAEPGSIVGTPGFMAPEMVLEPDTADARTDVYQLGATLHQILTGSLRHRGSSLYETLASSLASDPYAYDASVPADLAALANAATRPERADRPASAAAFRRALQDHARHKEGLALVAAARDTLAPLRDRAIPIEDPRAAPILSEASVALSAAARVVADHPSLLEARREQLLLAIERDLALESPASARALAAQLASPPPDLEARIEALEARVARAKASEEELARARADADTSGALGARRWMLALAFVPIVGVTVLLSSTGLAGGAELTVRGMVTTDVAALSLLLVGVAIARRRVLANRGNRTLTWYAVLGFTMTAGTNLASYLVDPAMPIASASVHTHCVVAAWFAAGAVLLHPRFGWGTLGSIVAIALMVLVPEHAAIVSPIAIGGIALAALAGITAYGRAQAQR